MESGHKIIDEKKTHTYKLRFWNGHLQSALFNRGCTPGKESRVFPKNVGKAHVSHFIRGFFDAHVSVSEGGDPIIKQIQIYYNLPFLIELHEQLIQAGAVRDRSPPEKSPLGYRSAEDVAGIHRFLYRDLDYIHRSGLYLPSKKERFGM
ncbi:hypothetical protein HYU13_03250 [Candidatus Woesearchaeota archaeon]|nr:hypothetical protein [Candidatus Woesearchaeota archaeon]